MGYKYAKLTHIAEPSSQMHNCSTTFSSHIITPKTHNLPNLSPSQPTTRCNLIKSALCSNNLICSPLITATSSTLRPKNFSQALGLQTSLPVAMHPVSSARRPTIRGLRERAMGVEQLRQGVEVVLEKVGTPQLGVVSVWKVQSDG
jgi:hypothetical protein